MIYLTVHSIICTTLIIEVGPMVHTLRYFHTCSSQVPNFPEYISVGYVNNIQITHYDSETKKYVPKQEWMKNISEEDPKYWERQTQISRENEHTEKLSIESAIRRLNVTEGAHVWQNMYGCDWDDETNEIKGYDQYAFDGEDFIALDWESQTFVAPKQQAVSTKLYWEKTGYVVHQKNYIIKECVEYLKMHVRHGESVLKRTVLPSVYLLQKSSLSRVTCFATGFFPDRAMLFWAKDGVELEDTGQIRPNEDGTFQSSVTLDLSFVPPEDWDRYSCVFQLSGVKDDLITKLEQSKIRTNERSHTAQILAAGALVGAAAVAAMMFFMYKKWKAKQPTLPPSEPELQELNPAAQPQ